MKTLLKGGTVVSAAGSRAADVLVDGEKIAAVGEGTFLRRARDPENRSAAAHGAAQYGHDPERREF